MAQGGTTVSPLAKYKLVRQSNPPAHRVVVGADTAPAVQRFAMPQRAAISQGQHCKIATMHSTGVSGRSVGGEDQYNHTLHVRWRPSLISLCLCLAVALPDSNHWPDLTATSWCRYDKFDNTYQVGIALQLSRVLDYRPCVDGSRSAARKKLCGPS